MGTELIRRRAGDRVGLVIFAEHGAGRGAALLRRRWRGPRAGADRHRAGGPLDGDGRRARARGETPLRIEGADAHHHPAVGRLEQCRLDGPLGVAALAHKLGIRIYTIGFGPNDTTRPQDDPDSVDYGALQTYAKIGNGEAFRVRNAEDFEDAGAKIEKLIAGEAMAPPAVIHDELWPWPAAVAMASAFAMVAMRRRTR